MAVAEKLTIEDFEMLPDALACYRELVDGELVDVSGNTPEHLFVRDYLASLLLPYVRQRGLGRIIAEQEYRFGENAHGPDLSLIGPAKLELIDRKRRVQLFVPDLAIEIASKNDTFAAIVQKARSYLRHGTSEVWVFLISTREAYFYSPEFDRILREDQTFATALIPGFEIPIADLFDQA